MIVDHKLSNVVLKVDDHAAAHPELYWRGEAAFDEAARALAIHGTVDFLTYVNACSAGKWRRYAAIDIVILAMEVVGVGEVAVTAVDAGSEEPRVVERRAVDGAASLTFSVPTEGVDLVGFTLTAAPGATLAISRAWYAARVEASALNDVRLALSTTTFKKEHYIVPNIELVRAGIAAEGGDIAERFHMFVVDNGRTLDAAALSDDRVTVIPNPNTGGAGGFARGMLAALDSPAAFTHILLMDDDVRVMPESFIRTFNLLRLAHGRYRDAFINGAMLSLEEPARQFEDVSYVVRSGAYRRIKEDLHVDRLADILVNERTNVEVEQAYGAWWFSCIPLAAVRERGLPMPFFVRCDDVEFGMRNAPTYMTMDGICVWHESFEGRFRASVDCYQYIRNFYAMIAVDGCASERLFTVRLRRSVRQDLRDLDYAAAELLLDGFEDYLKGPSFLETADGAALMAEKGKRNERLQPVAELDQTVLAAAGVTPSVLAHASLEFTPPRFMKYWRSLPYDKHYLPDFLLRKRPGYVVKNGAATLEGSSAACTTVVFLDPTRKKGAIRHMDRARFRAIRARERQLLGRYRAEGARVRQAWQDAFPYLTSRAFWESYLGMR